MNYQDYPSSVGFLAMLGAKAEAWGEMAVILAESGADIKFAKVCMHMCDGYLDMMREASELLEMTPEDRNSYIADATEKLRRSA